MLGFADSSPGLTQLCFIPQPLMCTLLILFVQTGVKVVKAQGGSSTAPTRNHGKLQFLIWDIQNHEKV